MRELPCITVNDAYKLAPWAEIHYGASPEWWKEHYAEVAKCAGRCVSVRTGHPMQPPHPNRSIEIASIVDKPGLSTTPGLLHHGKNSGYQAINLALLFGAKRILLLGYDMKGGPGAHFFGSHEAPLKGCSNYAKFIAGFRTIKPEDYGIQVLNCSRDTALDAFPVVTLEAALAAKAEEAAA